MSVGIKAFMDTERDQRDNIIEIGIAVFKDGLLEKTYESRIKTRVRIDPIIVELTGITNKDLENAPEKEEVIKEINEFLKEIGVDVLVCNTWGRENSYVRKMNRGQIEKANIVCKDVQMEITRPITKETKHNIGLEKMAKALGIEFEQTHNALEDAIITGKIYYESRNIEKRKKILTLAKKEEEVLYGKWKEKTDFEKVEHIYKQTRDHRLKEEKENPPMYGTEEEITSRLIENAEKVRKGKFGKETEKGRTFFEKSLRNLREDYKRLRRLHKGSDSFYVKNKIEIIKTLSYGKDLIHEISVELFDNTKENHEFLAEAIELKEMVHARDNLQIIFLDEEFTKDVKEKVRRLTEHMIDQSIAKSRKEKMKKRYLQDMENEIKQTVKKAKEEQKEKENKEAQESA